MHYTGHSRISHGQAIALFIRRSYCYIITYH